MPVPKEFLYIVLACETKALCHQLDQQQGVLFDAELLQGAIDRIHEARCSTHIKMRIKFIAIFCYEFLIDFAVRIF